MQETTNEAQAISKDSLVKILLENHKEMLPLWYCQLNSWEIPEGFPIVINKYENHKDSYNDSQNRIAFDAVCEALGHKEQSRAWWTIVLKRTDSEWESWWENRNSLPA